MLNQRLPFMCVWLFGNHNRLGHLTNQSRVRGKEGLTEETEVDRAVSDTVRKDGLVEKDTLI